MRRDVRDLILKSISEKGRMLNDEEALDFYVEKIMRNKGGCRYSNYANYDRDLKIFKGGYKELSLEELQSRSVQWHKLAIGSLVLDGYLGAFRR